MTFVTRVIGIGLGKTPDMKTEGNQIIEETSDEKRYSEFINRKYFR